MYLGKHYFNEKGSSQEEKYENERNGYTKDKGEHHDEETDREELERGDSWRRFESVFSCI
jgi:hypothetical protein